MKQEEKAKAYDEVLQKAKEIVNDQNASSVWKGWLCSCFPELKESEDEKIRKWLIKYFNKADFNGMLEYVNGIKAEDILAWLEKQGEQKPTDKVEPKFKIGDRVRYKGHSCDGVITEITDTYYMCGYAKLPISTQDKLELVERKPLRMVSAEAKEALFDYENANIQQKDFASKNGQKPAEWSEEDERIISKILGICEDFKSSFRISPASSKIVQKDIDKINTWLKSIKERIQK